MKKTNLIRFVQSLVLLPVMSVQLATANINSNQISPSLLVQKVNIEAKAKAKAIARDAESEALRLAEANQKKADAIDNYFASRGMPLAGTGMKMVIEAEKNGIDWRLLPAIAARESTGGKFACKKVTYSAFGWGSCKINFQSHDHGIEIVAKNLGGNNPKTARYYGNKEIVEILQAYNPPSVVPKYAEQVISIMDTIGEADVVELAQS